MSLSQINVNNQQIISIDDKPEFNSENLLKSEGTKIDIDVLSHSVENIYSNINDNGDCRLVTHRNGYIHYQTGQLIYNTVLTQEVVVYDVSGLDAVTLRAYNKDMSAKYYSFFTSFENNSLSISGTKYDYAYGYNYLTVPEGAKYLGLICMFSSVGSADMLKCMSFKINIERPLSNLYARMKMVPLVAVCDNAYLDYQTGVFTTSSSNKLDNSLQTCVYDVSGLSQVVIMTTRSRNEVSVVDYMSFYESFDFQHHPEPINGIQHYNVRGKKTMTVPENANYMCIMTKYNNQGSPDSIFVSQADIISDIDKKCDDTFGLLNNGMSLIPMTQHDGFLVRNDTFFEAEGSSVSKSFTSEWIDVNEGDTFVYLGYGSLGDRLEPTEITEEQSQLGCSWLFGNSEGVVSAWSVHNSSLTPIDVIIPEGITRVRFSSLYLYSGSYNRNFVIRKQSALDWLTIRPWAHKRWVVVGDSLTEANRRATVQYYNYVQQVTGIMTSNYGKSGSGYKELEDSNLSIRQRIQSIPSKYDVLTIFGSGNDLHSGNDGQMKYTLGDVTDQTNDTICGCINMTLDWLHANRPLKPVGIVTPTPWKGYGGAIPSNPGNRMDLYVQKLIQIANRHGVPVLDLYHESMLHPELNDFRNVAYTRDGTYSASSEGTTNAIQVTAKNLDAVQKCGLPNAEIGDWVLPNLDGTHPDEYGHEMIAPLFKDFIGKLML